MAQFEDYSHIATLLVHAKQGELAEEERRALEAWRKAARENEALYRKVLAADFEPAHAEMHSHFDAEAAYCAVRALCRRRARRRVAYWISGVAAVCLLAVGLAGYWMALPEEQAPQMLAEAIIPPGEAKAELILADGASVFLGTGVQDSVFEQPGARVHTSGKHLNYVKGARTAEMQYNILRIPRGGEYTVVLQDGTAVQLNSASELRYPVQFVGDERRVYLSGEAYFEVAKDSRHPFIVETGNTEIEVLGTSFNISAYAEEQRTETTLVEGAVRFSAGGGEVTLAPGEQGVWDAAGRLDKREVDVYPYIAWTEGKFVFRKRSLEEVMRIVSRWYNVDVVFESEEPRGISFSGNIRRYEDFSQVVRMLEMTGGLEFRIVERTIYIAAK